MGKIRGRTVSSGTSTQIHRPDEHPGLPGIRYDRGLSGDARWIFGASTIPTGLDRPSAGPDRLPRSGAIRNRSQRHAGKRYRGTFGNPRRTGDARTTVHAWILEGASGYRIGLARWLVLVG